MVLESPGSFYEPLLLTDPQKPHKPRTVVNVLGEMRAYQLRLYKQVLLPKLDPSEYSHGGVRGRSIKTNATPHLGSKYIATMDISDFYPSIHYTRVYSQFINLKCSPDVARICTRICTYQRHLALGLITSPILADQMLSRVDKRIGGACAKEGLTYTRFVDDITISGPYSLEKSGFAKLVQRILADDGFHANPAKHKYGRFDENETITNLREVRGHLDVRREYYNELIRQLEDAARLARDEHFDGPYYTRSQIRGRVQFVCWINPGRRRDLISRFRSIQWHLVEKNARARSLEVSCKTLTKVKPDLG